MNVEVVKLLGENGICGVTNLFNTIYETGILLTNWFKSTFVMIPKKTREARETLPGVEVLVERRRDIIHDLYIY